MCCVQALGCWEWGLAYVSMSMWTHCWAAGTIHCDTCPRRWCRGTTGQETDLRGTPRILDLFISSLSPQHTIPDGRGPESLWINLSAGWWSTPSVTLRATRPSSSPAYPQLCVCDPKLYWLFWHDLGGVRVSGTPWTMGRATIRPPLAQPTTRTWRRPIETRVCPHTFASLPGSHRIYVKETNSYTFVQVFFQWQSSI